ncbi:flavin reductase family protein [bacterium]|nr:flavin reductase family protein [candidate division CSSED10-310 bacterium]
MNGFTSIDPADFTEPIFERIGHDWFLLTAGIPGAFNTMTCSWGGMGVLWNQPVCFVFVRPGRYTYHFVEREDLFTLSFFDTRYRSALSFCGTHSGRTVDKTRETGLTPICPDAGGIAFAEASIIVTCRKLYADDLKESGCVDRAIVTLYPEKDYHRMLIGGIQGILKK